MPPSTRSKSNRNIILAVALLFLSVCGARDSAPVTGPGGELVRNGGFETGDRLPDNWSRDERRTGRSGSVAVDKGKHHSGSASLRLQPSASNNSNDPLAVYQMIPAGSWAGQTVRVSGFVAAEGGATAGIGVLSIVKGRPQALEMRTSQSNEWESQTIDYSVPNDSSTQLVLTCLSGGTSGTAWCDDFSIIAAGSAPSSKPSTSTSAQNAEPFQASVRVDSAAVVRTIPRTLYGANIEWIWNANLAFVEDQHRVHPEVTRLTRDLGVTLIRYPGGLFSDYYHWKTGVGPVAQRPIVAHEPGKSDKTRPNFGTDEALAFADSVGAELLITVNAGTGTAEEAAEWVRYVNRDRLRVRFWEVGNELYIKDGSPMSKATTVPPEEYASRFMKFAAAMRAADSRIQIGAIGGSNQGKYAVVSYKDWDRIVLQNAGSQIDFFSVHNAYAPLVNDTSASLRTVYRGMLAAPANIARNLQTVSNEIQQYAPDRASRITIAVTEYGPAFQFAPGGRWVDHAKTLGSAIFAASTIKTFIESNRTSIANYFLLNDLAVLGLIGSRNGQFPPQPDWIPTARYYALQLYAKHFGETLVRSSTQSPTFNAEAIGLVDAVNNAPLVECVSSLSADGRTLYLMLINKDFDRPADVNIGFEPAANGSAWTLNGTAIDANTGTTPLRIPGVNWGRQTEESRFSRGSMTEVTLQQSSVGNASRQFTYRSSAHSVTSLVLTRKP